MRIFGLAWFANGATKVPVCNEARRNFICVRSSTAAERNGEGQRAASSLSLSLLPRFRAPTRKQHDPVHPPTMGVVPWRGRHSSSHGSSRQHLASLPERRTVG